ncbi:hypothetical protein K437DRAFT_119439, partial [Tilletiaria anomala UBC 951]
VSDRVGAFTYLARDAQYRCRPRPNSRSGAIEVSHTRESNLQWLAGYRYRRGATRHLGRFLVGWKLRRTTCAPRQEPLHCNSRYCEDSVCPVARCTDCRQLQGNRRSSSDRRDRSACHEHSLTSSRMARPARSATSSSMPAVAAPSQLSSQASMTTI